MRRLIPPDETANLGTEGLGLFDQAPATGQSVAIDDIRIDPQAWPNLDGLADKVVVKWRSFLEEPEAAAVLTTVARAACDLARRGATWISGEHLLDAARKAGHTVDNNLRAPLARFVMAQHPHLRPLFRTRTSKGKAA